MADSQIREIDRDLDSLTSEFRRFVSNFDRLGQKVDEMHREIGTREGKDMHKQVDEFEQKIDKLEDKITEIQRETHATRKLVEYGDVKLKEIMRALSLIYQNTDELESNLIEAENINTNP